MIKDWELFVEVAKRFGANTSKAANAPMIDAVRLDGMFVIYDFNEYRAYAKFITDVRTSSKTWWLDNNILVWIDTLRGKM